MGIGRASGEARAREAAKQAINSPLLELSIDGAKGVIFNVSGGSDIRMNEVNEAAQIITGSIDPNAKVIFGAVVDDGLRKGEVKITVIATGFGQEKEIFAEEKEENKKIIKEEIKEGVIEEEKSIVAKQSFETKVSPVQEKENEFDIPAFIRKKIKEK